MTENNHVLAFDPWHPIPNPPAASYSLSLSMRISPYEFTNWRDETTSWKTTCYLHAGLNPTDTYKIRGERVLDFLGRVCATNMKNFEVGRIKHGLCVDEQGRVLCDGVMMRTAEDEVTTYWMVPILNYYLDKMYGEEYGVTGELVTDQVFLFQIGGPVSLEVVEAATGEDFHDMKHLRYRDSQICGHPVQICRVGMAGTIAYEVHGDIRDAHEVYNKLWEVGEPLGMRRLGSHCYPMNHAENGFPQLKVHFLEPRSQMDGLMDYLKSTPGMEFQIMTCDENGFILDGSAADDRNAFFHNPYEFGWGRMIHLDHDFVGREACEKMAADPATRKVVTFEWNADDVADVFASQFKGEDVEPYKPIESPSDVEFWMSPFVHHDYVVDADGSKIGTSFGRQNACYFRHMISIGCIDPAFAEEGTEVYVLWGNPGQRQKKIRAKIARYPYNNVMRSDATDVSKR